MFFRQIFDPQLAQYAYLIGCQQTGEAIVIDPERDIDRYLRIAEQEDLRIVAATETHIHADFLSGTRELADQLGVKLYLSDEGDENWKYGWTDDYDVQLLKDGDTFEVGHIRIQALHTPGHTPEHLSFLITDAGGGATEPMGIASGDFVFVGDLGRPDLLETAAGIEGAREPAARRLYESTSRFLELPDHTQVWPGHGAGSACGKALGAVPQSTVGYERRHNVALSFDRETRFVESILEGQPEPPLYFARMKRLNRDGVPVLGSMPTPEHVTVERLLSVGISDSAVIIDARHDRRAYLEGHVAGSVYAPLGVYFPMVVGSYVEPDAEIYLVIDEEDLDEAVRALVRIGYDRIVGYVPPGALDGTTELASIGWVDFADFDAEPDTSQTTVLDVRGAAEFEGAHIPGSLNIAYTHLARRLDELPKGKPLAVHCRSGARASAAVSLLERAGYDVTLVDGIFADWPGWKGESVEAVLT